MNDSTASSSARIGGQDAGFVRVLNSTPALLRSVGNTAKNVWLYLLECRDWATNEVSRYRQAIAEEIGVTVRAVAKALVELREAGLVSWESRNRRQSTYRVSGVMKAGDRHRRDDMGTTWEDPVRGNSSSSVEGTPVPPYSRSLFNQETPPTPRRDLVTARGVPDAKGGDFSQTDSPASPAPATPDGGPAGMASDREAKDLAREAVPEVSCFDDLDAMIAAQADSLMPGQSVADHRVRAEYEGPSLSGIRPEFVGDAVLAAIGTSASRSLSSWVYNRLMSSVAAMGRYGEVTPQMMESALEAPGAKDSRGLNGMRYATALWRKVQEARWQHTRVSASVKAMYGDHRPRPRGIATRDPRWADWLVTPGKVVEHGRVS